MQNYSRVLPLAKLKMSFRISEKTSFIVHYSLYIMHSHFAERSEDILHSAFCILHSAFKLQFIPYNSRKTSKTLTKRVLAISCKVWYDIDTGKKRHPRGL